MPPFFSTGRAVPSCWPLLCTHPRPTRDQNLPGTNATRVARAADVRHGVGRATARAAPLHTVDPALAVQVRLLQAPLPLHPRPMNPDHPLPQHPHPVNRDCPMPSHPRPANPDCHANPRHTEIYHPPLCWRSGAP